MDQFLWWSGALFWMSVCLVAAILAILMIRVLLFSKEIEEPEESIGIRRMASHHPQD